MAPPTKSFPASTLETEILLDASSKRRKTPDGKPIDLSRCQEVNQIVQYLCEVVPANNHSAFADQGSSSSGSNSKIVCYPVPRSFRRCRDKNGTFMVETTAWEKLHQGRS